VRRPIFLAVSTIFARPILGLPLPIMIESRTATVLIECVSAWVSVIDPPYEWP
jgi:hypothetical protein